MCGYSVIQSSLYRFDWNKPEQTNKLTFRLISYEARWEAARAVFDENRVIPVYKPLDAKLVYPNFAQISDKLFRWLENSLL